MNVHASIRFSIGHDYFDSTLAVTRYLHPFTAFAGLALYHITN